MNKDLPDRIITTGRLSKIGLWPILNSHMRVVLLCWLGPFFDTGVVIMTSSPAWPSGHLFTSLVNWKLVAPLIRVRILYPIYCIVILGANMKQCHMLP